jgi:hypothetical protein
VKPTKPAATTARTTSTKIVFMTFSRDRSATPVAIRHRKAESVQYPMARRGEAEKSGRDNRYDRKRDDFPHDALP